MEPYKDQPNEKNKAIYSELAIAWEPITISCALAETQIGRGVGILYWKGRRLPCLTGGCGHGAAIEGRCPTQSDRGAYLAFSVWHKLEAGAKSRAAVSF